MTFGTTAAHRAMFRTANAARDLIARGEVEPFAGLSYAIWPTQAMEEASREVSTVGHEVEGREAVRPRPDAVG